MSSLSMQIVPSHGSSRVIKVDMETSHCTKGANEVVLFYSRVEWVCETWLSMMVDGIGNLTEKTTCSDADKEACVV